VRWLQVASLSCLVAVVSWKLSGHLHGAQFPSNVMTAIEVNLLSNFLFGWTLRIVGAKSFAAPIVTISWYELASFWHNSAMWRTDDGRSYRQTDRRPGHSYDSVLHSSAHQAVLTSCKAKNQCCLTCRKSFMYLYEVTLRTAFTVAVYAYLVVLSTLFFTAICRPACRGNQVCKAPPQTCECIRSGGGACTYGMCQYALLTLVDVFW